jgi:serine/threonine protein phosphatase PrpC
MPRPMRLAHGAATHIGRVRTKNDDSMLVLPGALYAVADGMGGHPAGDVASRIAVETLDGFGASNFTLPANHGRRGALSTLFDAAHRRVLHEMREHPELAGMGTTMTALAFDPANWRASLAHVGDSRGYIVRRSFGGGAYASQITNDHCTDNGLLTNCIGVSPRSHMTTEFSFPSVAPGDVYVLCTDGLATYMTNKLLVRMAKDYVMPQTLADKLVDHALVSGGADNVTVIVVRIQQE